MAEKDILLPVRAGVQFGFWMAPKLANLANNMRPFRSTPIAKPSTEAARLRFGQRSLDMRQAAAVIDSFRRMPRDDQPPAERPRRFSRNKPIDAAAHAKELGRQVLGEVELETSAEPSEELEPIGLA